MLNYKKIIIIGCCGGGKSTFAKQLADVTGIPLYHLDNIYWQPDASHLERPEFIDKQKDIMKNDRWIIDGNYGATIKLRLKQCELVYFFDMATDVCLEGVFNRDKKRNDIACEIEPDEELLDYIKNYRKKSRPKVKYLLKSHPSIKTIIFKTHNDVDDYLAELKKEYDY